MTDNNFTRPSHYCDGRKYEPKDVIRDWELNFNLGNAVKYIARNGKKEGESALKDLNKAKQYLEFEIEYLEKTEKENAEVCRKNVAGKKRPDSEDKKSN